MRCLLSLAVVALFAVPSVSFADEVAEVDEAMMGAADEVAVAEGVHEAAHDVGHGADHGEGHHEEGMPLPMLSTAVASLIVFLIFAALLAKFAWAPLMEGLNKREENIRGAMVEAQNARDEAKAMLAEHTRRMDGVDAEVKEIIAEARRDAEHTAGEIKAKATAEAEASRVRALTEIERAKDAAIIELAARERDLVADATETVLGRAITAEDRTRLIDEALSQFTQKA